MDFRFPCLLAGVYLDAILFNSRTGNSTMMCLGRKLWNDLKGLIVRVNMKGIRSIISNVWTTWAFAVFLLDDQSSSNLHRKPFCLWDSLVWLWYLGRVELYLYIYIYRYKNIYIYIYIFIYIYIRVFLMVCMYIYIYIRVYIYICVFWDTVKTSVGYFSKGGSSRVQKVHQTM